MNHSEIYRLIGAPLKNVRNSWGSINKMGYPILTVWYDERSKTTAHAFKILSNPKSAKRCSGFIERQNHVDLIRAGSPYLMVMATAKDIDSPVRSIMHLDDDYLYVGGSTFEDTEGNIFGTYTEKIHLSKI